MDKTVVFTKAKDYKFVKLFVGILFDLIGMLSYTIPFFAEITDIIWAPIAGFTLAYMYKGAVGKIGGIITFLEEVIPGTDFIPTFTIIWFYEYYFQKK